MPWIWVVVGLVFWTVAAFAVIVLCTSVRQIDARLRDRYANEAGPRPGTRAKVD